MTLDEIIGAIESCRSTSELTRALQSVCEEYGFSSFNFLETDAAHLDVPFFLGTMKADFAGDYFSNKLIHVDPCISHARRSNIPFTWSEVPFPQYRGAKKSGAQKTLEVASDHGYKEGLIVPFHFSDRIGRVHSSLVVFFWNDPLQRFRFVVSRKRYELHLVMIYWAQRAVDLVEQQFHAGGAPAGPPLETAATCILTDREKDVLSWAARGKTALDTAEILRLSEETVKTHIRNALSKLAASNKTHGVAKAIYLGLIDV